MSDPAWRYVGSKKAKTLHTTDLFVFKMAQHATDAHESFVCLTVPVTAPLEGFYGEERLLLNTGAEELWLIARSDAFLSRL